MGIITHFYKKNFICRYDKEIGVPYYAYTDFIGLRQEIYSFTNSRRIEITYFYYYYDNYKTDKIILFCHGLGPGHASYLAEIETLARRGYKVLTLDYTGCGESKGKNMISLNTPTSDVIELLDFLNIKVPIVLVGHSLGGYTALNVINLRDDIKKAVILSGFLSIKPLLGHFVKSDFIIRHLLKYESKKEPKYYPLNNIDYLGKTDNQILFIQSDDDQMVPFDIGLGLVEKIDNPCIKKLRLTGRKHNPNYTDSAVAYMNEVFGGYQKMLNEKKKKTDDEIIAYFKDVSLSRLVEQDQKLFDQIQDFIERQ